MFPTRARRRDFYSNQFSRWKVMTDADIVFEINLKLTTKLSLICQSIVLHAMVRMRQIVRQVFDLISLLVQLHCLIAEHTPSSLTNRPKVKSLPGPHQTILILSCHRPRPCRRCPRRGVQPPGR